MKKYTLLIIIGGLFLMIGIIYSFGKKKENIIYQEKTNLTQEEASSLILEKTRTIIDLYEKPKEAFMLDKEQDSESEYLNILNYDAIVYNMYTEKGIKELENIKFNNKPFIKKEEDEVFVLKTIPDNNIYSNCSISISNISIINDEIKATVSLTRNEIDQNNVLTYHVFEKNIELIKKDNKWLINSFIYSNV